MATRRPSDERPSSEERRARARAERRIVMPSNRVSRPKGTVRSSSFRNSAVFLCSTLLIRISSVGAGRNKTEELLRRQ